MKRPHLRVKHHRDGSSSYWFDHGGTPRRWTRLGKEEARALVEYEKILATPKPSPGSVDQMLAETIEALELGTLRKSDGSRVKPQTIRLYKQYRRHLAAVFAEPPETITQADVLRYLRICPRTTFRNEIGVLSLGFAYWMDKGRLTFNPCFGVRVRRQAPRRERLLAGEEIQRIVDAADERTAVAIELAYATGLRISDLCALRWSDIGKPIETRKTGARLEIESSDALSPILARARSLQARVASLYVLCARGGRQWKPSALRAQWRKATKAAGIGNAHFHDLRAAGATAVEAELGQRAAQEFLGHKDARTTLVYLRGLRVNKIRPLRRKA